ncbi:UPF0389 protein CG9231-like [Uloborus diversus]|uniref:UPF0389 protein CG9231-like n=1 Tax=Uloborus diversus TaxID=327109 RepID=UPI002409C67B|nr:UPF0389 protein CG9231-like [Uloborus diversus]XP_054708023.1 UPF0389 protein CG9231-like [Uloborus diversus]
MKMLESKGFPAIRRNIFNHFFAEKSVCLQPNNVLYGCKRYATDKAHAPNTLEKYLLVWMKKYPSVKEVPNHVTFAMMERVRNSARIRIGIFLTILTGLVSVGMIYSGKQAAKRGESLVKMNRQWHEEQNAKK